MGSAPVRKSFSGEAGVVVAVIVIIPVQRKHSPGYSASDTDNRKIAQNCSAWISGGWHKFVSVRLSLPGFKMAGKVASVGKSAL